MKAKVVRAWEVDGSTLGFLSFDGISHCPLVTLENDLKIPAGTYTCRPYSSKKWPGVYEVTGVPGRTAILFHWGNTKKDSLGCILVGCQVGMIGKDVAILDSRKGIETIKKIVGMKEFDVTIVDVPLV